MTFYRRMNDRWNRGIFPFKTLFDLSRYDFRFPRYRRAKKKVIFNRLPSLRPCRLFGPLARASSLWPNPNSRQATDAIPGKTWEAFPRKICRSLTRESIHNLCTVFKRHGHFESLYLGNRSRYRDEPKSDFDSMLSSIFWVNLMTKF